MAKLILESWLCASFGRQYSGSVSFDDVGDFMVDAYAMRYICNNAQIDKSDLVRVLTALANLLRNCNEYDITEIFLATLRLKRIKNTTYYAVVEY